MKVFYLRTGVIKKPQTTPELPMLYQVITLVVKWVKSSSRGGMQYRLSFLNHHNHKFGWENDNIYYSEVLVEDSHPEILVQMPGIDL